MPSNKKSSRKAKNLPQFSTYSGNKPLLDLLEIQRKSFFDLLEYGIVQELAKIAIFRETAKDSAVTRELELVFNPETYKLVSPNCTPKQAILKGKTYACKLYVQATLTIRSTPHKSVREKDSNPLLFNRQNKEKKLPRFASKTKSFLFFSHYKRLKKKTKNEFLFQLVKNNVPSKLAGGTKWQTSLSLSYPEGVSKALGKLVSASQAQRGIKVETKGLSSSDCNQRLLDKHTLEKNWYTLLNNNIFNNPNHVSDQLLQSLRLQNLSDIKKRKLITPTPLYPYTSLGFEIRGQEGRALSKKVSNKLSTSKTNYLQFLINLGKEESSPEKVFILASLEKKTFENNKQNRLHTPLSKDIFFKTYTLGKTLGKIKEVKLLSVRGKPKSIKLADTKSLNKLTDKIGIHKFDTSVDLGFLRNALVRSTFYGKSNIYRKFLIPKTYFFAYPEGVTDLDRTFDIFQKYKGLYVLSTGGRNQRGIKVASDYSFGAREAAKGITTESKKNTSVRFLDTKLITSADLTNLNIKSADTPKSKGVVAPGGNLRWSFFWKKTKTISYVNKYLNASVDANKTYITDGVNKKHKNGRAIFSKIDHPIEFIFTIKHFLVPPYSIKGFINLASTQNLRVQGSLWTANYDTKGFNFHNQLANNKNQGMLTEKIQDRESHLEELIKFANSKSNLELMNRKVFNTSYASLFRKTKKWENSYITHCLTNYQAKSIDFVNNLTTLFFENATNNLVDNDVFFTSIWPKQNVGTYNILQRLIKERKKNIGLPLRFRPWSTTSTLLQKCNKVYSWLSDPLGNFPSDFVDQKRAFGGSETWIFQSNWSQKSGNAREKKELCFPFVVPVYPVTKNNRFSFLSTKSLGKLPKGLDKINLISLSSPFQDHSSRFFDLTLTSHGNKKLQHKTFIETWLPPLGKVQTPLTYAAAYPLGVRQSRNQQMPFAFDKSASFFSTPSGYQFRKPLGVTNKSPRYNVDNELIFQEDKFISTRISSKSMSKGSLNLKSYKLTPLKIFGRPLTFSGALFSTATKNSGQSEEYSKMYGEPLRLKISKRKTTTFIETPARLTKYKTEKEKTKIGYANIHAGGEDWFSLSFKEQTHLKGITDTLSITPSPYSCQNKSSNIEYISPFLNKINGIRNYWESPWKKVSQFNTNFSALQAFWSTKNFISKSVDSSDMFCVNKVESEDIRHDELASPRFWLRKNFTEINTLDSYSSLPPKIPNSRVLFQEGKMEFIMPVDKVASEAAKGAGRLESKETKGSMTNLVTPADTKWHKGPIIELQQSPSEAKRRNEDGNQRLLDYDIVGFGDTRIPDNLVFNTLSATPNDMGKFSHSLKCEAKEKYTIAGKQVVVNSVNAKFNKVNDTIINTLWSPTRLTQNKKYLSKLRNVTLFLPIKPVAASFDSLVDFVEPERVRLAASGATFESQTSFVLPEKIRDSVDTFDSVENPTGVQEIKRRVKTSNETQKKPSTDAQETENIQTFHPWIFLGELPLMTKRGHFILNGSPRVIVNQIARCPGIYFQEKRRGVGFEQEVRVSADIIPQRGPWLRIQSDWEGRFWARLKQEGRVKYATLYGAFQEFEKQYSAPLVSLIAGNYSVFPKSEILAFQEKKAKEDRQKKALIRLFKNSTRYSLGYLGRFRIDERMHSTPLLQTNTLGPFSDYPFRVKDSDSKKKNLVPALPTEITSRTALSQIRKPSGYSEGVIASDFADTNFFFTGASTSLLSNFLRDPRLTTRITKLIKEKVDTLTYLPKVNQVSVRNTLTDATKWQMSMEIQKMYVQSTLFKLMEWPKNKMSQNLPSLPFTLINLCHQVIVDKVETEKIYADSSSYLISGYHTPRKLQVPFTLNPIYVKGSTKSCRPEVETEGVEEISDPGNSTVDRQSRTPRNNTQNIKKYFASLNEAKYLLMAEDIDAVHTCLERLLEGQGFTDDIDHLKNRFIRTSGKLLQQQFELGLHRLNEVITPLLKNFIQSPALSSLSTPFDKVDYTDLPKDLFGVSKMKRSKNLGAKSIGTSGISNSLQEENNFSTVSSLQNEIYKGIIYGNNPQIVSNQKWAGEVADVSSNNFGNVSEKLTLVRLVDRRSKPKGYKSGNQRGNDRVKKRGFTIGSKIYTNAENNLTKKGQNTPSQLIWKKTLNTPTLPYLLPYESHGAYEKLKTLFSRTEGFIPMGSTKSTRSRNKTTVLQRDKKSFASLILKSLFTSSGSQSSKLSNSQVRDKNSYKTVTSPFRWLRTSKPINGAFREFFGSNPLSQYMDQSNPLAEITHKRRLSSMGPGGIKRETAGMEVRGIHPTHYGRICPIETPEGKNAGLVNSPTVYGRVGSEGFMETPLYQVVQSQIQTKRWAFFSAEQEENEETSLATCDVGLVRFNLLSHVPISVQTANNPLAHFQQVERNRVGYRALSPVQTISIATALIPFLEHDDANRALMGSNMQRQAIPLLLPERPIVGTGFEPIVIAESGQALQATKTGYVSYVSATKIIVHSIHSAGKTLPQSILRDSTDKSYFAYPFGVTAKYAPKNIGVISVLDTEGAGIIVNQVSTTKNLLSSTPLSLGVRQSRPAFGSIYYSYSFSGHDTYEVENVGVNTHERKVSKRQPEGFDKVDKQFLATEGCNPNSVRAITKINDPSISIPQGPKNSVVAASQAQLVPSVLRNCLVSASQAPRGTSVETKESLASAHFSSQNLLSSCFASNKFSHEIMARLHLCSTHNAFLLKGVEQPLQLYQRSNQETCLSQRPLVQQGDWVQKGDFIADCSASHLGDLALGKNVTVAYMPWEGYNFEDAIVISDRLVADDVYTSIHIERYEVKVSKNSQGKEKITNQIPSLPSRSLKHLDDSGIARVSSWVQPGDILVGKVVELKRPLSPYERLAWELASRLSPNSPEREKWLNKVWLEDISLRLPPGVCGRIINSHVVSTEWSEKEQVAYPLEVHIYLAVKRKIQVGDKLAGRHGNKGIVSIILPRQDMPYLGDGSTIDMVLNPLGVPSRMNLGQIFECLLGLAGSQLGCNFKITPFDEIAGGEASRSLVFLKLYQCRLIYKQQWLFTPTFPGKCKLFDGRTGEPFENWVTVGQAYILKLIHMVDHKIHARSTGPYSLFTRQPVRGRSRRGGQRLGEMEVWAVEGFGAAYTLQEFLTIKSDDLKARASLQRSFYKQNDVTLGNVHISPGNPEAFKVLVSELQALCLHIHM